MVIRRFDVVRNPNPRTRRPVPYLVVLQSELLDGLDTRVVAPLARAGGVEGRAAERLNPAFEVDGERVVMLTQMVGAAPLASLVRVGSLESERHRIVDALDLLFSGI
ncbi:MAG: CcdB family protein [Pseudomonadota bacterium]